MEEKEYQVERCQRKEAGFGHFALSVFLFSVSCWVLILVLSPVKVRFLGAWRVITGKWFCIAYCFNFQMFLRSGLIIIIRSMYCYC